MTEVINFVDSHGFTIIILEIADWLQFLVNHRDKEELQSLKEEIVRS